MTLSLPLAMGGGWEPEFTGRRELDYESHLNASPGLTAAL